MYFLYAVLMVLDMIVFALMAMRYKYVEPKEMSEANDAELTSNDIEKQK